jgi:hypothetical protein
LAQQRQWQCCTLLQLSMSCIRPACLSCADHLCCCWWLLPEPKNTHGVALLVCALPCVPEDSYLVCCGLLLRAAAACTASGLGL